MALATQLCVWGIVAHMVADWFLQNEWMALNKVSLRHPASWVHSAIHFAALCFVFWWPVALALAVSHLLIDTRVPLIWWRRLYRQTTEGPVMIPFAMWQDQAAHIIAIGAAALLVGLR
jgi:high-affinity K+ transport system ATPase subunit B